MNAIFCDLDGTLLHDDKTLSQESIFAVQNLTKNGYRFVVATGRGVLAAQSVLKALQTPVDLIACNGAYVEIAGKPSLNVGFTWSEALALTKGIESLGLSYSIYSGALWLSPVRDSHVQKEEFLVKAQSTQGTLNDLPKDAIINKIMVMMTEDEINHNQRTLQAMFPEYSIQNSLNYLLEITKKGVHKGTACEHYAKTIGVNLADCMAFGDGYIDMPMLEVVGKPFAMANSVDAVKKAFPKNIILSNNDNGVYKKLVDLGCIEAYV